MNPDNRQDISRLEYLYPLTVAAGVTEALSAATSLIEAEEIIKQMYPSDGMVKVNVSALLASDGNCTVDVGLPALEPLQCILAADYYFVSVELDLDTSWPIQVAFIVRKDGPTLLNIVAAFGSSIQLPQLIAIVSNASQGISPKDTLALINI